MDEMNNSGSPEEEIREKAPEGEEIKLWDNPKRKRRERKTSYVYEVPVSEKEETPGGEEPVEPVKEERVQEEPSEASEAVTGPEKKELSEDTSEKTLKREKFKKNKKTEKPVAETSVEENMLDQELVGKDNISRSERLRLLKKRMVDGSNETSSALKDFFRVVGENYKRILTVLLIAAVIVVASVIYNRNRMYHRFETRWQLSSVESADSSYVVFGDVILHYSRNGVSCIDQTGEVLWDQAFNMDIPGLAMCGDYAVIYDVKGNDIYIVNKTGCTGNAKTKKAILKADISAFGVVAVILDAPTSNYINYYDNDGKLIELEIKALISGEGYPVDIAVSPNGTELMTSYSFSDVGKQMNQVVFRNFEVGKTDVNRVVGGFRHYEELMVPDVMFFDNDTACAVIENGLDFYSTRRADKPEIAKNHTYASPIRSVFHNENYVGVILEPEKADGTENGDSIVVDVTEAKPEAEEGTSYKLYVYNKNGEKAFEYTVDFDYERAAFSGDGIVIFNKSHISVLNLNGVCKYDATLDMNIENVLRFSETSIVVQGDEALRMLKLR